MTGHESGQNCTVQARSQDLSWGGGGGGCAYLKSRSQKINVLIIRYATSEDRNGAECPTNGLLN